MTTRKFHKLQKKYNKPRDPKQQEKYQEYKKKIQEIMKKPPNNRLYINIGINELADISIGGSKGYFYDPKEKVWCVYEVLTRERSNDIDFLIYKKMSTEEEAFQYIYILLEENVKRYEWDLKREKNDRMTKEEFLEWFGQDNREARLAEKEPYQILWDRQPGDEQYAVGYYKELYGEHYEWVAYVIINGKYDMECPYKHETRAIYMMQYWIQRIIDGKMG